MESFRKQLNEGNLNSDARELRSIVSSLMDMKERVNRHALNNGDTTITTIIDDGILIGKLEAVIKILASEVFKR